MPFLPLHPLAAVAQFEPLWPLHTSIAITAAVAAMSCAVPGVWLVMRRHSMMGDALSHTALPGIVVAFLAATALRAAGWLTESGYETTEHLILLAGAVAAGLATAWLTEWVQQIGRVEGNAALGVVFTALFALGLFLVRFAVDSVHLDLDCVLFGRLVEAAVFDPVVVFGREVPRAVLVNGGLLLLNLTLMVLCFKELRIAAFDPALATVQGINARAIHYAHMALTAVTVVAAFESVGSILVVGLLVVPAATAQLLTDRLKPLIGLALLLAAAAAVVGHWLSQILPEAVFRPLGFDQVKDASTPGMIALTSGLLFVVAWLVSPRHGLIARAVNQLRLAVRIVSEDVLGALFRQNEQHAGAPLSEEFLSSLSRRMTLGGLLSRWTLRRFSAAGLVVATEGGYLLTPKGQARAREVVRGHRLWESYLDRHFELPVDHLHESAHRAEHYLTGELRERMAAELDAPRADPHGRQIPGDASESPDSNSR